MEYYSAIKKNEIMLFADKWMELKIIMLSNITHAQKDKGDIFLSYVENRPIRFVNTYIFIYIHTYIHI
jgi:hypothetical protein